MSGLTPQCCHLGIQSARRWPVRGGGARAARLPARTGRQRPPSPSRALGRRTHIVQPTRQCPLTRMLVLNVQLTSQPGPLSSADTSQH